MELLASWTDAVGSTVTGDIRKTLPKLPCGCSAQENEMRKKGRSSGMEVNP